MAVSHNFYVVVTISWSQESNTVEEADRVEQICATLTGDLETNLMPVFVRIHQGTAIQNHGIY